MKLFYSTLLMIVALLLSTTNVSAQQRKKAVRKTSVAASAAQRPKLPIEYVAERNLGAVTDDNKSSKYENLNASTAHIPRGFHMPSIEEWAGIFPLNGVLSFEDDTELLGNYEPVCIAGEMYSFESDYQRNDRICYALRFKDEENLFLCAYRYKCMGRWTRGTLDSGVEVQVVYLGPAFKGSLQTIASEDYWTKNKQKVIRRYFPAPGFKRRDYPDMIDSPGTLAYYWSSQSNIVIEMTTEGVNSGKLEPWFESVCRPFANE